MTQSVKHAIKSLTVDSMASSYLFWLGVVFLLSDFHVALFISIGWLIYAIMCTRSFSTNNLCFVLLIGAFATISYAKFTRFVTISFFSFFTIMRILIFSIIAFSSIMIFGVKVIIVSFFIVVVVIWEIFIFGVFLRTLFVLCLLMYALRWNFNLVTLFKFMAMGR